MPGKQLNPQHPAPHQQHRKKNLEHLSPDRMKKGMEELRPDWQIDQSIQSRAQFSNTKQELKAVSTATTSAKFQVFTQAFIKPATAYLQSNQDGC